MEKPGDPEVARFQVAVNRELSRNGYQMIGTDGQVGPTVCGAWAWLGSLADASWQDNPDLMLSEKLSDDRMTCKAFAMPKKIGSTTAWDPGTIVTQTNQGQGAPPWGVLDDRTTDLQRRLNVQLEAMGFNTIPVDGKLGPATCGAMKFAKDEWGMDELTTFGKNCQSFLLPTKKAAPPPPVATGPAPSSLPRPSSSSGFSQATVVGGLIAAGVVAALYAANKKKR